ncbi:hypothetical protein NDN08_008145 [Rhodosorus marinus]|uniref:ERCC4 domain-containing protein n=1 Tax=Rhodosorus marinus TaxID=101924 RepID=A0AAV8V3H5_9RHOD|nr:hypothetical protein NDN08_008145 [Rhodosorus marinus]
MMKRLYDKILEEVRDEDGLVVLGHGLGASFAFTNLVDSVLKDSPEGSIVLGLQISPALAAELSRHVIESGKSSSAPRLITSEYSIPERREVYASGGFLAATARILVHDFLRSVIPVNKVVGIIVNDAHRVQETTAEAFVLRLYRKNNKEGFIKAFTEEPEVLRKGFHNCEKIMRSLYVRRLFLWPRFHEIVQDVLDTRPADVVELTQPMTTSMMAIQQSILDVTAFCLGELKRANRNVDLTEIKIEEALYRSFHDIIKNQLEAVWHTTGAKVRQPLEDLKFLRKLLSNLHKLDCIQFHELVESLRQGDGFQSTWLMTREADIVFTLARIRVYRSALRSSNLMEEYFPVGEKENGKENRLQDGDSVVVSPVLELNPKWNLLQDVLEEIESDGKRIENPNPRAIIFVRDEITAIQISQFLCKGGEQMLVDDFERFLKHRSNRLYRNAIQKSMTHTKEDIGDSSGGLQTTLTQFSRPGEENKRKAYVIVRSQSQEMEKNDEGTVTVAGSSGAATRTEDTFPISASSETAQTKVEIVLSIVSNIPGNVKRLLDDLQPSFVVIYDPVVHCVRQVEMYKADHPGQQLRVYFVTYEESVEQKRYLYSVQREQEAFEALIREKETMIIHANQEGRLEDEQLDETLVGSELGIGRSLGVDRDSRLLKSAKNIPGKKIVVDMRELRSSLCGILHGAGMDLVPLTLPIGDYILSPSICVERKSIPDLVSSFSSGRLFNQVEKMTRYYKTPCLLLEFDQSRPFCLATSAELDKQVSISSVVAKTVILTQQFPQLRLLWCRTPFEAANLLQELKIGEEEPDEELAATLGLQEEDPEADGGINHRQLHFLRTLPGISNRNIRKVLESVSTIKELVELPLEELEKILGNSDAKVLYEFLSADASAMDVHVD